MSLDKFIQAPPPAERCSNPLCRKILGVKEPKHTLIVKGEKRLFCRECYRSHLPKPKPQEAREEESLSEGDDTAG